MMVEMMVEVEVEGPFYTVCPFCSSRGIKSGLVRFMNVIFFSRVWENCPAVNIYWGTWSCSSSRTDTLKSLRNPHPRPPKQWKMTKITKDGTSLFYYNAVSRS